ncbi:ROK family protein [Nonomuraea sp. NPDC046570]|uniref:ROK family protein n=1 Tax=Nonomuraea sp. NPDC046570 TaxID=3155255 RepID=UPI0033E897A7
MYGAKTSGELRAHNRVRLLRAIHDRAAASTRSQLTRALDLARGTASVLVGGLAEDELLHEEPAAEQARGRPTQVPGPHPNGPLVLAADLREDAWELAACELGGRYTVLETRGHDGSPEGALLPLGAAIRDRLTPRVVGVGLSAAGPVRWGRILDIAHLGWADVDLAAMLPMAVPLHVGNDARLAGLAEARRGRLRGVGVGLHLHVDFDLGGSLLIEGRPLTGASGTAGEFGHMPLTGGGRPCPCGAIGCWSLDVGGNALLRHAGLSAGGGRGRPHADRLVRQAGDGDAAALAAVTAVARALGTGIGALVNAHDPEVVTLSGLGVDLHALAGRALSETYAEGLMAFRERQPPPIVPSALGRAGPLTGAMESVFDAFLTVEGLDAWRSARSG